MRLILGVLGEPSVGNIPTHFLLAGGVPKEGEGNGPQLRDKDGNCWRVFDRLPAEEMLDSLDKCHALVILPPKDALFGINPRDAIVTDLWALRKHRGKNALPNGLPVLLIRAGREEQGIASAAKDAPFVFGDDFSRGFGGVHLVEVVKPGLLEDPARCFSEIGKEAIRRASKYREKARWSSARLWLTVLLLATFSLSLLGSFFYLALNPEISLVLQVRQLKHGLSEINPFLLKAESTEVLEERLAAIEGFLDQNRGISSIRILSLMECRQRLRLFLRKIRESQLWPRPEEIHDLPTLRQVVESVGRWNPGDPFQQGYPLVDEAFGRREALGIQLSEAEALFSHLEKQQSRGEKLLRENPGSPVDFRNWLQASEAYNSEVEALTRKSSWWNLDELSDAKDGCLDLQKKVRAVAGLVRGLGLASLPGEAQGALDPRGAHFEEEMAKALTTLQECEKGFPSGGIPLRGDSQLVKTIRSKASLAYQAWLKEGRVRLGLGIQQARKSRGSLMEWVGQTKREPVWRNWGELVWKLAAVANAELGALGSSNTPDPWMECSTFLQTASFQVRPERAVIQAPTGSFGKEPGDWELVFRTESNTDELVLIGTSIETKGKTDVLSLQRQNAKAIRWDWLSPLVVQMRSRTHKEKIRGWQAASPSESLKPIEDNSMKLFWFPEDSLPKVPALLAP